MSKTLPIALVHGANLNMLGKREETHYGTLTLTELVAKTTAAAHAHGLQVIDFQSNHEGALLDFIHMARDTTGGMIINAGAYTHTSIALYDALLIYGKPIIEVHLSNIYARETFRRHSYISPLAKGVICGLGVDGYLAAIHAMAAIFSPSSHP
jgi:3-dehydroquinate dehydratase II